MSNPFIPEKNYKHIITTITPRDKVVVLFHKRQEVLVEHDDEDPAKFLVKEEPVVEQEIPLNEYIQQFDRETDLKEKIGRLRNREEYEAFIGEIGLPANGRVYEQKEYLSDLEMEAIIARGTEVWEALDPELRKDKTKEEFLAEFNEKQFTNYLNGKMQNALEEANKLKKKEGEE